MEDFLNQVYFNNQVVDYLQALAVVLVGVVALNVFRSIILKRIEAWSAKTETTIDDFIVLLLKKAVSPLLYVGIVYVAAHILIISAGVKRGLDIAGMAAIAYYVAKAATMFIAYGAGEYLRRSGQSQALSKSINGMMKVAGFLVWAVAAIFLLDNLGFKVSTVLAGLGIGGIAIGLAAQSVLQDVFSYFSILFDKPFTIGDFIVVGDHKGTVENLGVKTSRIRSVDGELIVLSNRTLTDSIVRNYKHMEARRATFSLGVTYETSLTQLKAIPAILEKIIKNAGNAKFDRAHFKSYGAFSLDFEVVYYVLNGDYNQYMDIQQQINFAVKEEFNQRGIVFAYPTQTILMGK